MQPIRPVSVIALGTMLLSILAPFGTSSAAAEIVLVNSSPEWARATSAPAPDEELTAQLLFTPTATDAEREQATTWIANQGAELGESRPAIDAIEFSGSTELLADAFHTEFVSVETAHGTAIAPAVDLQIPSELTAVQSIAGLIEVDAMRPTTATQSPAAEGPSDSNATSDDCATYWGERLSEQWPDNHGIEYRSNALCGYGPEQLRAVHELPAQAQGEGATIAIIGVFDDPSVEANTNHYFAEAGALPFTEGQYTSHAPEQPDEERCGGPQSWTVEQHLDVQAAHAIAPAADIVYWGADTCTTEDLYLRILDAVLADQPDAISLSFGAPEELDTDADRELLNRILVEAASQGVSVFASTGNEGDYSLYGDHHEGPQVVSPASSPYITAVGGTSVGLGEEDELVVEAGWAIQTRFARNNAIIAPGFHHGGGGGESAYYDRPSWQLDLAQPGTGRLLPDVASLADPNTGFTIYAPISGALQYEAHGGTSLATPMVAATVAVAKAHTGVEIGLATPHLYSLSDTDALRDVVPQSAATWYRRDSSTGQVWLETLYVWDSAPQSLQSAPGWDPLTGLGVPAGTSFLDMFGNTE